MRPDPRGGRRAAVSPARRLAHQVCEELGPRCGITEPGIDAAGPTPAFYG